MPPGKILAQNRRARHDYFIEDSYECGIELYGMEVKSIRLGQANLKDSYAMITNGEVFLHNLHISPYEKANQFNREALRVRRLLMHKAEIRKLIGYTQQKGLTLIPLSLYLSHGLVKVELAVCRGKKNYDKREAIAQRDIQREQQREFSQQR